MYDRVVDVPRLLCFYSEHDPLPHPALDAARSTLNEHYADELGEPFTTAGLCLYRDGADSVAWHGDTIGRGRTVDTMVAILSLGSPREFLLRPRGGGAAARAVAGRTDGARPVSGAGTIRHTLQHGDLIVMGGSCQRTWEHAVPKTSRPVGPRISVQFRPRNVF
jgi:alkylated DNA repair dioxygenase AlkB